jgi:hypothetical protein
VIEKLPMIWIILVIVAAIVGYEIVEQSNADSLPDGTSSGNGFIDAFAQAIAGQENVDSSANNPGALSAGDVDSSNIVGTFNSAGVVIINDIQNGWSALFSKLQNIMSGASTVFNPGMTIQQFVGTYTTGNPDDDSDATNNYAQGVADSLGVTTDTTLSDAQADYDSGGN